MGDRSWERQEDVPVLGSEELSYGDVAATVSEVVGCEVSYQHLPSTAWRVSYASAA